MDRIDQRIQELERQIREFIADNREALQWLEDSFVELEDLKELPSDRLQNGGKLPIIGHT